MIINKDVVKHVQEVEGKGGEALAALLYGYGQRRRREKPRRKERRKEMSRAKETRIVQESQRVFNFIKTAAKIVVAVSVVAIIYSVATYQDSDKKAIKAIFQEQMKKEIEEEMARIVKELRN